MARQARSARGKVVNFDLLAIKQQLATKPVTVNANQRRKFIDEKDGVKTKQENYITPPPEVPSTLSIAQEAAAASAEAAKKHKKE